MRIADPVTPVEFILEEVSFTNFEVMRSTFEHIASCDHLRSIAVHLEKESEVEELERIIQRVGANVQDLTITCWEPFASLAKVIKIIPKLRSLVVHRSPLHLSVIQVIERYHLESLEVLENIPMFSGWPHDIVDSRIDGSRLEAIMRLCAQCPRLKVFRPSLISVSFEQLQESEWAAMDNITRLGLSINGLRELNLEEGLRKSEEIHGWLRKFKMLKSVEILTDGPDGPKFQWG